MKNQKGMGHLMLILCIAIILFIIVALVCVGKIQLQNQILETYQTDMLLIQGKVKVLSKEATMQKKEEILIGKKIEESLEEESIKKLLENGIISKEEENFSKYYLLEKANLEEMGLTTIKLRKGYFIVNYETDEVIYSEGIASNGKTYYKLSELK